MAQVWSNNARTTLAAPLTANATAATVASGAAFVPLAAGDRETVTIEDGETREIVTVTARDGAAWTLLRAQEGTAARDWSAGATVEARLTAGALAGLLQAAAVPDLLALDHGGAARGAGAINLQSGRERDDQVAAGEGAIAVGANGAALGQFSLTIGTGGVAYGDESAVLGPVCAMAQHGIAMSGFHFIPADDYNDAWEVGAAGAVAAFCTPYVDLGVPPAWAANTEYRHGDLVRPTAGGAVQYRVVATRDPGNAYARPVVTSATTEPTWPGHGQEVTIAGGLPLAWWAGWVGRDWSDTAGYRTSIVPEGLTFFPTAIAFVCHAHSALTGTPNVSIGTAATPGLLVDAADVTIAGAPQIYRFAIANPAAGIPGGTTIDIVINAPASAGRCAGRFLLSGVFVGDPHV